MLTSYAVEGTAIGVAEGLPTDPESLRQAVWIDLFEPSAEEEHAVQAALRVEVPTRDEMREIEASSRIYREGDALFLTTNILDHIADGEYGSTPITFVLTGDQLVTLRYATPKVIPAFVASSTRDPALLASADAAMLHLFAAMVAWLADVQENVAAGMDESSRLIFRAARTGKNRTLRAAQRQEALRTTLVALGGVGEVTSRASETLLGLSRILAFVQAQKASLVRQENQVLIKTLQRDVRSLVEHATFLSSKANFLLDAVLGLINVEQNAIVKAFTIAAVALMPPTLVASVYGMNFEHMPELRWAVGYPLSLMLMVLSAALPVWWFRRKGWL